MAFNTQAGNIFDQGVQLAFRQIKVNDLVALAAVKMLMGVGVPVKAFGTADHANAADHIVISQGVQIAVHRAQADMRAALTGITVNLLRRKMLFMLLMVSRIIWRCQEYFIASVLLKVTDGSSSTHF